ncbi:MAG TPA: DUF2235 domain-containing protein [Noviherbaspirillum sp.]|nr:DUF2235 domain-containing protein [Noviherbaspirillum sp.]
MGTTDKRPEGVETYPADQHDLDSYRQAQTSLDEMRIPVLLHADNKHERLFVAALDGTGNSMFDDKPENWSVVAKIRNQIEESKLDNIASGYVEGTFSQEGLFHTPERLWDGRYAHTFDNRVETAYYQLCIQAKKWIDEDPKTQIRVAGVGFSRGAEEVAALQRMIEERGIRDPADAKLELDGKKFDGETLITSIKYADVPELVAPGKTLQAALLFDPVDTGVEEHDRRLPPSTMSTFQITAEDERRNLFKANDHIPADFSENNRNLNVTVGGAHSDVGDTYKQNGLGVRSLNLGVEYLNRLSDRDFLQKRTVPNDPAKSVVHRSDQGMYGLYGTSAYDKDGVRDHVNQLAPAALCKNSAAIDCQQKEPISPELEKQIERRTGPMPNGPSPDKQEPGIPTASETMPPGRDTPAKQAWNPLFLQMTDAALNGDAQGIEMAGRAYAQSIEGHAWLGQGQQLNVALAQQAEQEQQQAIQQAMAANEAQVQRGPVMRM